MARSCNREQDDSVTKTAWGGMYIVSFLCCFKIRSKLTCDIRKKRVHLKASGVRRLNEMQSAVMVLYRAS